MARITTIAVGFFLVATVTSAVLLLTGRTAAVDESPDYLSIVQAAADRAVAARRQAE